MLKNIAESQIKLGAEHIKSLNERLQGLGADMLGVSIISDDRIRLRYKINQVKAEIEYWRGVKNTAEIFLKEILDQEQRDQEEFEAALEEAPKDLSLYA